MPSSAELASGGVDLYLTSSESPCGTVTDTVHLTFSTSFINAAISADDLLCSSTATGTAMFAPDNGEFTYLWDDPAAQTTATATSLAAGTYSVLATDSYGCHTTLSVTITEPAELSIANLNVVNEQCAGDEHGSITAVVTGGTPPYQYAWSNGATTASIQAGAGIYSLRSRTPTAAPPHREVPPLRRMGNPIPPTQAWISSAATATCRSNSTAR